MCFIYKQALGLAVACRGVLQIAFNEVQKTLEISHWYGLKHLKLLFEWPMAANMSIEPDTDVMVGKTPKQLTKLIYRLGGIGRGHEEDMESRSVMV